MTESTQSKHQKTDTEALPFAAPCRDLPTNAPVRWIKLGWKDMRKAPGPSLGYGVLLVVLSYLLAALAVGFGNYMVLLALLSGFIFVGPLIAMAFYDISLQLQSGRTPSLGQSLRNSWRHIGNQMVFALILMIVFLVWARAASLIHVFFPALASPELSELALFLGVGTLVGSLFAAFVFCISAFSLPMIMDRDADMVTAAVTRRR